MTLPVNLLALLGVGLLTTGIACSIRGGRGAVASPLAIVGIVLLSAATAGFVGPSVPPWVLLSSVLGTAGLVGVGGLCLGTLRDDDRLATAGYWLGCSSFAVPVALVGTDALTVAVGTGATLLLAVAYGALAERTPARTVTVGSKG